MTNGGATSWSLGNQGYVIRKQCLLIKYPIHIKCGDKDISTNKDMTNEFDKFFTNIGSSLAKNISNSDGNFYIYDYLGGRIGNCLYLKPADEEEVINTVKSFTKNLQILKILAWIL